MLKNLWNLIKRVLGFPPGPADWQIGETIVTMREDRDCLVAAIATAAGVTYEVAAKAIGHFNLPWFLESPMLSNPVVAVKALKELGCNPDDKITLEQIQACDIPAMKLIILIHDYSSPFKAMVNQHWVVWGGVNPKSSESCLIYWGNSHEPRSIHMQELKAFYKAGWPNCAILLR